MDCLATRFEKEAFEPYLQLLKAEYRFHPVFHHAKQMWEEKLTPDELINGPYLEGSQTYKPGESLEMLGLHQKTVLTIHKRLAGRSLWKHQTDALRLLLRGKNAIIVTGTSSGKTLCYQIPILDDLIRDPSPGLRAVIIYPLNALVNDQLDDWELMLRDHPQITFARFTGQTPDDQLRYEERIKEAIRERYVDKHLTQQELERTIQQELQEELRKTIQNRLNHREAIRRNPPHILITNFSMLEYLLERPIDAAIFENARLNFLVLDEAHAYRGVQATEIAFLLRRLKDRLGLDRLTCIATSATLGKRDNPKVRIFACELFNEDFDEANPIHSTNDDPLLITPSFCPTPTQYIKAVESLRADSRSDVRQQLGMELPNNSLAGLLLHDGNLYRLRREILNKPKRLVDVAKELWPDHPQANDGLQALLELVASAKSDKAHEDLLPTRLHYFIRAQDGLHVCLHRQCPERREGKPAFFVSRKNNTETPEGFCPECFQEKQLSRLVEVVTCRKCGYLFGALQDLGPRRAQNPDSKSETIKPYFDSFSTELGWAADSFWSYFSVDDEMSYPSQSKTDEDEDDQDDLFANPARLEWCVICGKKNDKGAGDNCRCENPHLREIQIFHRQRPSDKHENIYEQHKKPLTSCPNCGGRNISGLEPFRRFQESDDETGLAMAIPLSHFQIGHTQGEYKPQRKLLCFTDHRQRAAAFPSLLEEETFAHDLGRKIVRIVCTENQTLDLISLGERLAEIADPGSDKYDPDFFLPVSRLPDEKKDAKAKTNSWIAETFSYFGIPDSARESAEDLGLVAVECRLKDNERFAFHSLFDASKVSVQESSYILQVLLGFMRQRKAFTLPKGRVNPEDPAFGRVTADIAYVLMREGGGTIQGKSVIGWLPRTNKDGSYRDNYVTDYLWRLFRFSSDQTLKLGKKIWQFLLSSNLLIETKGTWKLDHERLFITKAQSRYVCMRCAMVTAYSVRQCCLRKGCEGNLVMQPFDEKKQNIIARWVAGRGEPQFTGLRSEEHTAQINKELARIIEDEFRAEGINVLSSTTTFELGINIGDLQKVLLRNAPPTSASYVQRVGRAGRGIEKNSVCVTLCRRTKYDADAWNDPPRLMSGEIRTPTVFTRNKVIAQRHLNAVLFAKFLKQKIANEQALGTMRQHIRLEAFLPKTSRSDIPEGWLQIRPTNLFLDFLTWLEHQKEADIFQTEAGRSFLPAIIDFESGKIEAHKIYQHVIDKVGEELSELVFERKSIFKHGGQMSEVEQAIKNILGSDVISVLAKEGFLPRYAFPLNVVTLETGKSRWANEVDVELNRDRGIAIAEFAPGAQVVAHKKVFTSEGLYIASKNDKPDRKWYSRCPSCEQIRTARTQDALRGSCKVCARTIAEQFIRPFVEPVAFSIRIGSKERTTTRLRRSTLIRQRQTLTHFIDTVEDADFTEFELFRVALKEDGTLFRYNMGPENKGFVLCPICGHSEPLRGFKPGKKHKKLRVFTGDSNCTNEQPWTKPLAYGHQFNSFCLIARPIGQPSSVESLAYALQKGVCTLLDIETSDIGVSWRWLANKTDRTGSEIVLYDQTPGGAGFVKEAFENWEQVVGKTGEVCISCTCEKACYDCLKNYYNQPHHENLDRRTVTEYLRS